MNHVLRKIVISAFIVLPFLMSCDSSSSTDDASLENVWEVNTRHTIDGIYDFNFTYPLDVEGDDFDNDGSVETVMLTWYYDFQSDGVFRLYRHYSYTDPGTKTAWHDEYNLSEPDINEGSTLFCSLSRSGTYTSDGETVIISQSNGKTITAKYSISGNSLNLSIVNGTSYEDAVYKVSSDDLDFEAAIEY